MERKHASWDTEDFCLQTMITEKMLTHLMEL
jgi:hypothetical protein